VVRSDELLVVARREMMSTIPIGKVMNSKYRDQPSLPRTRKIGKRINITPMSVTTVAFFRVTANTAIAAWKKKAVWSMWAREATWASEGMRI